MAIAYYGGNLGGYVNPGPDFSGLSRGLSGASTALSQAMEREAEARRQREAEKKAKKEQKKQQLTGLGIGVGGALAGGAIGGLVAAPAAAAAAPAATATAAAPATAVGTGVGAGVGGTTAATLTPPQQAQAAFMRNAAGSTNPYVVQGAGQIANTAPFNAMSQPVMGPPVPPPPAQTVTVAPTPTLASAPAVNTAYPAPPTLPTYTMPSAGQRALTGAGLGLTSYLTGTNLLGPYLSQIQSIPDRNAQAAVQQYGMDVDRARFGLDEQRLALQGQQAQAEQQHWQAMENRQARPSSRSEFFDRMSPEQQASYLDYISGMKGRPSGRESVPTSPYAKPPWWLNPEAGLSAEEIAAATRANAGVGLSAGQIAGGVNNRTIRPEVANALVPSGVATVGGQGDRTNPLSLGEPQYATATTPTPLFQTPPSSPPKPTAFQQNWDYLRDRLNIQPGTAEEADALQRYANMTPPKTPTEPYGTRQLLDDYQARIDNALREDPTGESAYKLLEYGLTAQARNDKQNITAKEQADLKRYLENKLWLAGPGR